MVFEGLNPTVPGPKIIAAAMDQKNDGATALILVMKTNMARQISKAGSAARISRFQLRLWQVGGTQPKPSPYPHPYQKKYQDDDRR